MRFSKVAATVLTAGVVLALAGPAFAKGDCPFGGYKQTQTTSAPQSSSGQTATTATDKSDNGG